MKEYKQRVQSLSLPDTTRQEIDGLAASWMTNRTQAILRVYTEWKQLKAREERMLAAVAGAEMGKLEGGR